jgi:WD40 repeat protein
VVNDLTFSDDGQLLVVGGDKTVQVRDVRQKSFRTEPAEIGSQVLAAAVSPDGNRFAVSCADQTVRVYSCDLDSAHSELLLPVQSATALEKVPPLFLGNDRLIVSEDFESVRCWDLDRKEILWKYKPSRVLTWTISPDRKWLALGENYEVKLLDTATGEPAEKTIKYSNLINFLNFHPKSSLLLTACVDHTTHISEVPTGQSVGQPIPHCDGVNRCVWSPDGDSFATVHWTGDLVRVWKPCIHLQEKEVASQSAGGPFVRIHPQGNRWLSSGFDTFRARMELEIFDLETGKPIGPKLSGPGLISDADFIPNSPLVVVVGGGTYDDSRLGLTEQKLDGPGFIRFVNSETGVAAFEDVKTDSQPLAVRTTPDGRTAVVVCHQGHLQLLDTATGKVRAEHCAFDGQPASLGYVIRDRIRFFNGGRQFAVWGCNALTELRKTDTGERVAGISHGSGLIHDVQFSPIDKLVATCSSDQTLRLWNSETGASAGSPLAHSGWVFSAQFSQNGQRLLTASSDKQARIWDVATRTGILATRVHADQVFGVTFLPGEEHFLASSRDGQIAAYDSNFGKLIAPARKMPAMVYQLSRHESSSRVIASGEFHPLRTFDASQWIRDPDAQLSRDDVQLLGEILSSQRVHTSGAATSLTSAEWIERWQSFREKHPTCSVLRMEPPNPRNSE